MKMQEIIDQLKVLSQNADEAQVAVSEAESKASELEESINNFLWDLEKSLKAGQEDASLTHEDQINMIKEILK